MMAPELLVVLLLPIGLLFSFALGVPLVRAVQRSRSRAEGLAAVAAAGSAPGSLALQLEHPEPEVRQAAATALAAAPPSEALATLRPRLLAASEAAPEGALLALAGLAARDSARAGALELFEAAARAPGEVAPAAAAEGWAALAPAAARALEADPRPIVRLGLGTGLLRSEARAGAALLLELVAAGDVPVELREEALDALDAAPADAGLGERAGEHLRAGRVTPELLWVVAERGGPAELLLAADHLAAERYETAWAAMEAVAGVLRRHPQLPGPAVSEARTRLEAGKAALRAVHPPGDNRLADELIGRIERALAQL